MTMAPSTNGPFYYGKPFSTEEITEQAQIIQVLFDISRDSLLLKEGPIILSMIEANGGPQSPEEAKLVKAIKKDLEWLSKWG